ncbi:hypothetical protein A4H97_27380 [Niastella yeongjuensis]|uniref:Uncharacterized protein n=1 Tax=Niastella yeongjuensis TaxID=354355 RepID=A0A1V9EZC9_9BACT|nr:hypothetical protein A4H97_27380 [Niastella yeongjuensis]
MIIFYISQLGKCKSREPGEAEADKEGAACGWYIPTSRERGANIIGRYPTKQIKKNRMPKFLYFNIRYLKFNPPSPGLRRVSIV